MEKMIMAGDTALRVQDTGGDKPVVVLLHGYLESVEVWEDFIPLLTPRVRVIAPDLPGHGISEVKGDIHTMEFLADVVHAALESLEVEKYVLAGHSMGGYAACEFLRKYAGNLSGIILLHSTPNADTEAKKEQRQREIELVQAGKKELLARVNPEKGFAPENRKRMAGKIGELADQVMITEDEGIVALLRGMCRRRDLNETLRESGVPQLFILGRHDEHISPETAEALVAGHPRAQVAWLEHAGHMGFLEEPEATAGAMLAFIASASPGA